MALHRCALAVVVAVAAALVSVSARATTGAVRLPHVAHVVVVVFENHEESSIDEGNQAPAFERYAARYADLTNYTAVAHPSLPNYLALVSGSTQGVTDDCTTCGPWARSIGGLLTRAGKIVGRLRRGLPVVAAVCEEAHAVSLLHGRRSVTFTRCRASMPGGSRRSASSRRTSVTTLTIARSQRPNAFLAHWLPPLLQVPRTAVFVLFDEGTTSIGGGGQVDAFVAGTAVKRHAVVRRHVDHYTVLRTIEDLFGCPISVRPYETPLTGIWR